MKPLHYNNAPWDVLTPATPRQLVSLAGYIERRKINEEELLILTDGVALADLDVTRAGVLIKFFGENDFRQVRKKLAEKRADPSLTGLEKVKRIRPYNRKHWGDK